tara:strand:- start:4 stop:246 length:243 start_codon:yes stop_codon:yes gene_type:complete
MAYYVISMMLNTAETLSVTLQSIFNMSVVCKTTLLPDKISIVDPTGIGALNRTYASVFAAGAPVFTLVAVSLDNNTEAVT